MDSQHPLVAAAKAFLKVSVDVARDAAQQMEGCAALLHRPHLRLSTAFSGMGGGEFAVSLVGRALG